MFIFIFLFADEWENPLSVMEACAKIDDSIQSAEGDRTLQGMGGGVKAEWGLYASEEVVDRESIA